MAKKRDTHRQDHKERIASRLRDIILGGQDGIVNILGLVLGVAAATNDPKIVIIAGLASTFAESISMGAVAYTSTEASQAYYESLKRREAHEIRKHPKQEREEIRKIFAKKGIKGTVLTKVVQRVTASKRRWLATMMAEEIKVSPQKVKPLNSAVVVFIASLIGSLIPVLPFFFGVSILRAMWAAVFISGAVLWTTGVIKAKLTVGDPVKSGMQMLLIGLLSAGAGYLIGSILGAIL